MEFIWNGKQLYAECIISGDEHEHAYSYTMKYLKKL